MHACVETQDWDKLKDMILAGYREDMSNYDYKDYPLIFDVIHSDDPGASDMACFWLDHGYPHAVTGGRTRQTIAHAAASAGMPDVLRKLKSLGSDLNLDDQEGDTPLWNAAKFGNTECVRILLDAGADPDGFEERPDEDEFYHHPETPLAVAANAEIAQMLLDSGADPSICMYSALIGAEFDKFLSDELISPLARACLDGREETAKYLLARGVDPNALDGQAMRCLAISKNPSVDLLEALIKAGADVNGAEGKEPLRLAALAGNSELCIALFKYGAKPIAEALVLAVKAAKLPCLEILLKYRLGHTPDVILTAPREKQREIVDRLLEAYPDLGLGVALHGAIEGGHFKLASEIIKMGAPEGTTVPFEPRKAKSNQVKGNGKRRNPDASN